MHGTHAHAQVGLLRDASASRYQQTAQRRAAVTQVTYQAPLCIPLYYHHRTTRTQCWGGPCRLRLLACTPQLTMPLNRSARLRSCCAPLCLCLPCVPLEEGTVEGRGVQTLVGGAAKWALASITCQGASSKAPNHFNCYIVPYHGRNSSSIPRLLVAASYADNPVCLAGRQDESSRLSLHLLTMHPPTLH